MYTTREIAATTHLDLHHERLASSALEGMARQIRERYVPVMWNHDIRFPPLGRVTSARVVDLDDGEQALETESEIWESGDPIASLAGDGRVLVKEHFDAPGFEVRVDRGFRSEEDRQATVEIAQLDGRGRRPVLVGKKALEPDPVLVIAVGTIAGAIALGFFQRLGEDIYEQLKSRLARLVSEREQPLLIDFDITFEHDGRKTLHVLLHGPSSAQVEDLFDRRFEGVDIEVERCLQDVADLDRVVTSWVDGSIVLNYALRQDGVPVLLGRAIPSDLGLGPEEAGPTGR